ncbi:hypothetical protein BHM03_00045851 [Ensete ventricosum]|nr:hypothetical protein BHM03_00045851 [Ensete ventricosum]
MEVEGDGDGDDDGDAAPGFGQQHGSRHDVAVRQERVHGGSIARMNRRLPTALQVLFTLSSSSRVFLVILIR